MVTDYDEKPLRFCQRWGGNLGFINGSFLARSIWVIHLRGRRVLHLYVLYGEFVMSASLRMLEVCFCLCLFTCSFFCICEQRSVMLPLIYTHLSSVLPPFPFTSVIVPPTRFCTCYVFMLIIYVLSKKYYLSLHLWFLFIVAYAQSRHPTMWMTFAQ